MEIAFIRHAESIGNAQGIMQGRADYALSENGHRQAEKVAQYITTLDYPPIWSFMYSSPLSRTFETAEKIAKAVNLKFETHELLLEVDPGIFTGLTWEEAFAQHPDICKAFKQQKDWSAVPNGESRVHLWKRAETFLNYLLEKHEEKDTILVVSHGGFIRAMLAVFCGISPQQNLFISIDNTAISHLCIRHGHNYVRYVNNMAHLSSTDFIPENRFQS